MTRRPTMSRQALWRLVRQGESERVEFKLRVPGDRVIAADLSALANGRGGYLFIGINEKGEVIGLTKPEADLAEVRLKKVARSLLPAPIEVGSGDFQGRTIVYARVESVPRHLAPVVTADGAVFVRRGGTSMQLTEQDEEGLIRGRPNPPQPGRRVRAFIAMSFRTEQEPALIDYYRAIQRAVEATKLPIDVIRIDLVPGDYEISQHIMDEIQQCQIVLADFTLSPPNVYFELGFARGKGCEIIQTARKDTVLEFDVRNWRTEFYRNATELEEKLKPAVEAAYASVTGQA